MKKMTRCTSSFEDFGRQQDVAALGAVPERFHPEVENAVEQFGRAARTDQLVLAEGFPVVFHPLQEFVLLLIVRNQGKRFHASRREM
jgi:hypothetical protein